MQSNIGKGIDILKWSHRRNAMGTRELSQSLWTSIWLGLRGGSRISGKALYMYKGVCVGGGGGAGF